MINLTDKVIILQEQDGKIFYSSKKFVDRASYNDVLKNKYNVFRIVKYISDENVLVVKYDRPSTVEKRHYDMWLESNDSIYNELNLQTIQLKNPQPSIPYIPTPPTKTYFPKNHINNSLNDLPEREIRKALSLRMSDFIIEDGKAIYPHKIKTEFINEEIKFEINNPTLKKAYDAIKSYFGNFFDKQKVTLNIIVGHSGTHILKYEATSPEISSINDAMLDKIDDRLIEDYVINSQSEKLTGVGEKLKEMFGDNVDLSIKNEEWLLNKLINKAKTLHYKHLTFLSNEHDMLIGNIKITGKQLSFVFIIKSAEGYYCIWETYTTSEATYIWRLGSNICDIQTEIEELENRITWLRHNHRREYRKSAPIDFHFIEHQYHIGEYHGFDQWKKEFDSLLNR